MKRNIKHIILLLLVGTLISLVLLATSLSNLQLHAGAPFPGSPSSNEGAQPVTIVAPLWAYPIPMLRGITALLFIIFMIYIPARLLARLNLKIMLQLFLVLGALIVLAYLLPHITPAQQAYTRDEAFTVTALPPFDYPVTPLGSPPQGLIWFVIISLVVGMGWLVFILITQQLRSTKIQAELLQQAEGAVDALQAGMDLRNVIIRCYLQMAHAIQTEQGIERNDTMTAREFEDWLEQKGFPTMPVRQLTSLFEKVRYSKLPTDDEDEKIAADSLSEIIQFCRNEKV